MGIAARSRVSEMHRSPDPVKIRVAIPAPISRTTQRNDDRSIPQRRGTSLADFLMTKHYTYRLGNGFHNVRGDVRPA